MIINLIVKCLNNKEVNYMGGSLKERFISASFRFKKIDACFPTESSIPIGEWVVMDKISQGCLCSGSNLNVSEIQSCIPLSKPAVSQILNSLERKGYIIREIDLRDRRKISVVSTEEGNEVLKRTMADYDCMLEKVVTQFGEEDILTLIEYLERFIGVYEQLLYSDK
jgi:DNA-binding MarR family transcriptional regulator